MSGNVRKVTIYLASRDYERLAQLVRDGEYANIDDAVRTAVRRFLESEYDVVEMRDAEIRAAVERAVEREFEGVE